MIPDMKTLLVSIDFSPISQKVVDKAGELAAGLDAKIILFNVMEPVAAYVPVGAAMDVITAPIPVEPPDLELVREQLEKFAKPLRERPLSIESLVVEGLPAEEILRKARETGASMIVLGSHGHGAVYHLFSGSVVTAVLHQSEIPVTVIPVHSK
jgi:nucleotide-binding universal stress UspA family protein